MRLAKGSQLGAYEIIGLLGAGGMGEVYRARDTRLKRDVAIKILPEAFAQDADRLARFQREAELLATLNHPNIGSVYGLEQSPSAGSGLPPTAIVMELVEGNTLADRIARGALPLDEALHIAKQIAEALEAAHERGVIHRDLKPANIKITSEGQIKVLDFGLAKALAADHASATAGLSHSPTLSVLATQAGLVLGTAAYMSPEQAKALPADQRSDVFAFGVVLYEMLAGRAPFQGDTVPDVLASVLVREPELNVLPADLNPRLPELLKRCLEKNPRKRWQAIGDVRSELETILASPRTAHVAGTNRTPWWKWVATIAVTGLVAAVIGGAVVARWFQPAVASLPAFTFDVATPYASLGFAQIALSPRATHIAAITGSGVNGTLWLRRLDQTHGDVVPDTSNAAFPFWSPDGRFIGFFAGRKLKKVDIFGLPPQPIADAPAPRGGSWNEAGVILFAPKDTGPLFEVSAFDGRPPVQVTSLDASRDEIGHWHPMFLPDGRHFLFLAQSRKPENSAIFVGSLDDKKITLLVNSTAKAVFAPPDYLLWVRGDTLMAQVLDLRRLSLTGDPFTVAADVGANPVTGAAGISASMNGVLAHRPIGASAQTTLTWYHRGGKVLGTLGTSAPYRNPRLSPDGSRVVVERGDEGGVLSRDVWTIDVARQVPSRFTFAAAEGNRAPIWSPNGASIAWQSGTRTIFHWNSVSGDGVEKKFEQTEAGWVLDDWVDDRGILFHDGANPPISPGLRLFSMNGQASVISGAQSILTHARVSPDRRWVALTSSDTGRPEIYIQRFLTLGERTRVSPEGGIQPVWRRDGREIFYLAPDGKLMSVPVTLTERVIVGAPTALFQTSVEGGGTQSGGIWHSYDVSLDGSKFLVSTLVRPVEANVPPITIVVNWLAGLKR